MEISNNARFASFRSSPAAPSSAPPALPAEVLFSGATLATDAASLTTLAAAVPEGGAAITGDDGLVESSRLMSASCGLDNALADDALVADVAEIPSRALDAEDDAVESGTAPARDAPSPTSTDMSEMPRLCAIGGAGDNFPS